MTAAPSYDTTETYRTTRDNRVDRRNPCEWCGDTKYCLRFDDGGSFCRTVGEAHQRTDAFMGGYLHRASGQDSAPPPPPRPKTPAAEPADADTLYNVYTDLLARCPLSDEHRALLTGPQHGLTDEQAARYGTLPADLERRRAVARKVLSDCKVVSGATVPGFYLDKQQCQTVGYDGGILMPRRDLQERITGMMVRSDKPDADPRYLWLSSASASGPSCGSAAHIAQPTGGVQHPQTVYIVEGVKKADVISDRTGSLAISINGVGNVHAALEVFDALATQGVDTVVIALDRDVKPSAVEAVERARQLLAAAAAQRGYAVRIAAWDPADGKGPDDLLAAGHTFTLERYYPTGGGHIFAAATDTDDEGQCLVTVDPRVLRWMLTQVASTATLRARYHRLLSIVRDAALNDGQKLTAIALSARLPVSRVLNAPEPVTVYAANIACDLGSRVAVQKDGTRRPTKLNTVTKHLSDLVDLGAFTREVVEVPKVVTIVTKDGQPVEREIITKTFKYQAADALPGQRMKREEAREAATRAKAHRERPRCPRCYSTHLKPSAHVCLTCHTVSSDGDAVRAAEALVDHGDGRYTHRDTGELIVPGVPVEDFEADTAMRYQDCDGETSGDEKGRNETGYHIMGTTVRSEQGYRNVVSGPPADIDPRDDVADALSADRMTQTTPSRPRPPQIPCGGGCGALTDNGWTCKSCRNRPAAVLLINTGTAAGQGVRDDR